MRCWGRKTMFGLLAVALAVALLVPSARSAILPLLVVAACPIGMLVMMRGMTGGRSEHPAGNGSPEHPQPSADPKEDEIARLRADVQRLRAERDSGPSADASVADFGEGTAPLRRPGEDRGR